MRSWEFVTDDQCNKNNRTALRRVASWTLVSVVEGGWSHRWRGAFSPVEAVSRSPGGGGVVAEEVVRSEAVGADGSVRTLNWKQLL